MKEYTTDQIRNLVLASHGGAGKTSLAEAMLFNTGATTRIGKVEEGNTVSDFEAEETRRHISLSASIVPCEFNGYKLNVLDTPGYTDFTGEVRSAMRVAEGALILVDGTSGVEVGTELVWGYADEYHLPRLIVISKMDRDNANFQRTLERVRTAFTTTFVPVFLPIGEAAGFSGIVDLIAMKARRGPKAETGDIPADMADQAKAARTALIEASAEGDDELIMKYLEGEELSDEEIRRGLRAAIAKGSVVPVVCTAGSANLGVLPLMEFLAAFFPAPGERQAEVATLSGQDKTIELTAQDNGPLAVIAFKTRADPYVGRINYLRVFSGVLASNSQVYNATRNQAERIGQLYVMRGKEQIAVPQLHAGDIGGVTKLAATVTGDTLCDQARALTLQPVTYPHPLFSVAVEPKTKADSAKIGPTLTRLTEEDLTLHWHMEPSTGQMIVEGMGDQHIDVSMRRAEALGVGLITSTPRVPYRETISRSAETTYRHKKQTGGAGQFAEIAMRVEPQARGAGYEFLWEVVGGAVSGSFQSSIEKGIKSVLEQGAVAGYPVVDVQVAITDGKEHPVDSKPIAFEIAGREGFKQCIHEAGPVLLEPIMMVKITVPDSNMGDVLSDLNTRRARVHGMDQVSGKSIVTAHVPLAEMQRYATDLRSITGGRGVYSMEFSHYDPVPAHIAEGIIAAAQKAKEAPAE
jgi:elongation factor G